MRLNSSALTKSTIAVIWLIVGMTLLSEVSQPFKSFLVQVGGHHWVGKSILAAAAFFVCYLLLKRSGESKAVLAGALGVIGSAVVGGLVVFFFFVRNFFGA